MLDNRGGTVAGISGGGRGGTVCIDTERVLDSCRDRDCFEDARVYLTPYGNEILDQTSTVRVKDADIIGANIVLEPIQFNRGFYTVTVRFYVRVRCEACVGGRNGPKSQEFDGVAVLEKNVVLFGGESNVNVFRSKPGENDFCSVPDFCNRSANLPTGVVEAVDPVVLGVKVVEKKEECHCCCCCCEGEMPESVVSRIGGTLDFDDTDRQRYLVVTVGIFSVVRITRPAQYLINATEYSVPGKECVSPAGDDPCAVFRTMPFPTDEFSAGVAGHPEHDRDRDNHCSCGRN